MGYLSSIFSGSATEGSLFASVSVPDDVSVGFPVLPALIVIPLLGALALLAIPASRSELLRPLALLFTTATAALSFWLIGAYEIGRNVELFQFVSHHEWISSLGISWHLGVDGISLFLVALCGLLFPVAIIALDPDHHPKSYYVWLLVLEAGCIGTFLALDLLLFFLFFEIVLVPMYFLIGKWGHDNARYAAVKFFLYTMLGSAIMLVGIVSLAFLHAAQPGNDLTFDLVEIASAQSLATTTARWIFLAFAVAFAVKVPLFPLHTWLPDAHTEAPTAGSVILAGVLLKLGTYGFLRFGLYLFPEASVYFAPLFLTLGVVGILYGAVVATMQRDLKRLVAYSSVAHLGFIVLGLFAVTTESLEGSVLQMVNHGLSTGALFLLVGFIYQRRHTREIAKLGGLQRSVPLMAGIFMLVMLSSIGLPGLNGFVGEFLILVGTFSAHRWWAVAATIGVILAAVYLLWAYQRVFHGGGAGWGSGTNAAGGVTAPSSADNAAMPDIRWREGVALAPILVLIVFLGIYPRPVLDRISPAVEDLVQHVETHVEGYDHPSVGEGITGVGEAQGDSHSETAAPPATGSHTPELP